MVNPFVLLPLYWYPFSGGSAWEPVFSQITANPSTPFKVIINPSNGPGGPKPDAAFTDAVTKLHSFNNTQVIGYINVFYTTRASSDVFADIDAYASWPSNTLLDGVFFDEAPSDPASQPINYMSEVTSHVRSALGAKGIASPYVMFNPGTVVPQGYYDIADNIVAFEIDHSKFNEKTVDQIPAAHREKSSVILYGFQGGSSGQKDATSKIASGGIGGICITDSPSYNELSSIFKDLVSAVGDSGSGSPATPAPPVNPPSNPPSSTLVTSTVPAPTDVPTQPDVPSGTATSTQTRTRTRRPRPTGRRRYRVSAH